jgi:hypothetical protein
VIKNKPSPNSEDSTALGSFLNDLDNTSHDLLMIALNLEVDTKQSSVDKTKAY